MELIKALAIGLKEDDEFKGAWPEGSTQFRQRGTWYGDFQDEDGDEILEEVGFSGMPYVEEYDDGERVTKAEYEAFINANPNWYEDMQARRPFLIQEIARLNKVIASTIDEMTTLAEEAGVEVCIDLGQHGGLSPNSDWDSSRC